MTGGDHHLGPDDMPVGIDPRGPRFAWGLLCIVVLTAFVFQAAWVIPVWCVVQFLEALLPPTSDPVLAFFERVVAPRLSEPEWFEDPRPVRFAALVSAVLLALGSLLVLVGADTVAWVFALAAAAMAALAATTNLCLGCELYDRLEERRRH